MLGSKFPGNLNNLGATLEGLMLSFDIQGFSWLKGGTLCAYGNSGSVLGGVFLRYDLNCKSQTDLIVVDYFSVEDILFLLKRKEERKLLNANCLHKDVSCIERLCPYVGI